MSQSCFVNNPIILALDVDDETSALSIVDELQDVVGAFKLGPRLCVRYGQKLIQRISQKAPVFVDNKYFDIPSTTVAAVQTSFDAGASLVTVHALNGPETLKDLASLEKKLNQERPFKILCVTILTSFQAEHLSASFQPKEIPWHVKILSAEVKAAGLSGLVCSAHELNLIDAKNFFVVTPGIRMTNEVSSDQKRVMGPKEAIQAGAQALVVGRPILQATNRREAAKAYVSSCDPL